MGIVKPIDAQRRLATLGEIRIGEKAKTSGGKEYPRSLKHFRFTSRHKHLLEKLQASYGGIIRPWEGMPGQFELMSEADSISAYFSVKPIGDGDYESLSQFFEWREPKAGKLMRKCNGITCLTWDGKDRKEVPCLCEASGHQMCKVLSRVLVILPEVADLGAWTMRTGSSTFDRECSAFIENFRAMAPDMAIVPVKLTLTTRHKETAPESANGRFPVVTLSRDHSPKPFAQLANEIKAQLYAPVPMALGEVPVATPVLEASTEATTGEVITGVIGIADPKEQSTTGTPAPASVESDYDWLVSRVGQDPARDLISAFKGAEKDPDKFIASARKNDASAERIVELAQKELEVVA